MRIAKAHCFFEQSGTFRDEFIKLGVPAEDYDIGNYFGKTDHVIDLFSETEKSYKGEKSVFDKIGKDDLIMAFFPCIRFSEEALLLFRGHNSGMKAWDLKKKMQYDLTLHDELHNLYCLLTKLVLVCLQKELRLVIENPYGIRHYLTNYWALKPAIVDKDRTKNGDYYKKPTQYFFINCDPEQNFIFEPIEWSKLKIVEETKSEDEMPRNIVRSLIHPQYARRFIKMYLVDTNES